MNPNSATAPDNSLSRFLLPSIGNLVFVATLFILIFSLGNGLLNDGDTGYHIRTGELIAKTWQVPQTDPYSYHTPPLPWTAHEWLSELVMALIARGFGLTGIVVFFSFILAIAHWLLYQSLRRQSGDVLLCTLVTLLACATSSTHWLARPHAFSLLFTVIWCDHLNRFQPGSRSSLVLLPAVMLAWVNLHGGYFIGLVLIAVHFTGNLIEAIGAPSEKSRQKTKSLLALLVACIMICTINPQGPKILLFPLRLASDHFVMDSVTEFLSPNFHDFLPFKYMFLALIAALALSRLGLSLADTGLTVLLSYMSLYSVRHVSLFAIVLAPVLLKTTASALDRLPASVLRFYQIRSQNVKAVDANVKNWVWPSAATSLVLAFAALGVISYRFDDKVFPVKAVDFLKSEAIPGRMFNNDEFGDYIIFAAWPAYQVYIDGRSDMYGEKYAGDYFKVARVLPGWKEVLKKYDIGWVIFDTRSPLSGALSDQSDWRPIYSDPIATIFVKNDPRYATLLAKLSAVKSAGR
jgi:hypothetical protein